MYPAVPLPMLIHVTNGETITKEIKMKKTMALLATATLVVVGCDRQDSSMNDSAGAAKDQIEQAADAQKDALGQQKKEIEQSTDQAQDQISAQAKAEKERLESQANAEKAQIDAQQKQIEAQAAAAKADAEAQAKQASAQTDANQASAEAQIKVDEAAGAATATAQGTTDADRNLSKQIKESLTSQNATFANSGVTVMVMNGKVTLRGSVKTEEEKKNLEAQAKAVSGVTSVDNKLEVK